MNRVERAVWYGDVSGDVLSPNPSPASQRPPEFASRRHFSAR